MHRTGSGDGRRLARATACNDMTIATVILLLHFAVLHDRGRRGRAEGIRLIDGPRTRKVVRQARGIRRKPRATQQHHGFGHTLQLIVIGRIHNHHLPARPTDIDADCESLRRLASDVRDVRAAKERGDMALDNRRDWIRASVVSDTGTPFTRSRPSTSVRPIAGNAGHTTAIAFADQPSNAARTSAPI